MKSTFQRFRYALLLGVGLAVFGYPRNAEAHLVTSGMGPVYDGMGHLLMTPEDLIPVLAMALYAGLRGAAAARGIMFLLPVAWLAGGIAGAAVGVEVAYPIPAFSFLLLGGLVAADLAVPSVAVSGLALSLGLVHGFLNGTAIRQGGGTLSLVGVVAILFVLVTLVSAAVVSLRPFWTRIAVRVLGSWIAAIGFLMLGWALR